MQEHRERPADLGRLAARARADRFDQRLLGGAERLGGEGGEAGRLELLGRHAVLGFGWLARARFIYTVSRTLYFARDRACAIAPMRTCIGRDPARRDPAAAGAALLRAHAVRPQDRC